MAKSFLVSVDLNKNELQNARVQNLSSAPSTPVEGQIYHNTTDHNLYVWDGSGWVDCTSQGTTAPDADSGTKGILQLAGDLAGTAASPQIAAGVIVNNDINASAAIAYSKLNLASSVTNADLAGSIALSKLATDPLARANHTGTQTASTISDFDTQVRTSTLNQMAAPTADLNIGYKLTGVSTPTNGTDAANKTYVDNAVTGLDAKASVVAATTGSETYTVSAGAVTQISGTTLDGVSPTVNDRILIKDAPASSGAGSAGSNQPGNGIYTVTNATTNLSVSRATDQDNWSEVPNAYVWVETGTAGADSGWLVTSNAGGTINSTSMQWVQFNGLGQITAGNGLTKAGNTIDVVGTSNRISVAADAIDIHTSYVGQTSITTLGTIGTGTWQGTAVGTGYGGTGQNSAKAGRETGLGAAGYYTATGSGTASSFQITQATHGLRSQRWLLAQCQDVSTGAVVEVDITVNASGDVTFTFASSQVLTGYQFTIVG